MTKVQTIKKPTRQIQEQQPKNIQRADIAPAGGFALVLDGHFKSQFESVAAGQKVAKELLANYPMLQVEIYDASTKGRTLVKHLTQQCRVGAQHTLLLAGEGSFMSSGSGRCSLPWLTIFLHGLNNLPR